MEKWQGRLGACDERDRAKILWLLSAYHAWSFIKLALRHLYNNPSHFEERSRLESFIHNALYHEPSRCLRLCRAFLKRLYVEGNTELMDDVLRTITHRFVENRLSWPPKALRAARNVERLFLPEDEEQGY